MSDKKYDEMFPVKIDLGREEKPYDYPMSTSDSEKKKKPKKITIYPTLYISNVKGLESLPGKGCLLIKYEVEDIGARKDRYTGDFKGNVSLQVKCLCLPEKEESADSLIEEMFSKVEDAETSADEEMDEDDED